MNKDKKIMLAALCSLEARMKLLSNKIIQMEGELDDLGAEYEEILEQYEALEE